MGGEWEGRGEKREGRGGEGGEGARKTGRDEEGNRRERERKGRGREKKKRQKRKKLVLEREREREISGWKDEETYELDEKAATVHKAISLSHSFYNDKEKKKNKKREKEMIC